MKKILSFMLVLAMLAMMCINVSAATTEDIVGTRVTDDTNDASEGVIGANATQTNSYAVSAICGANVHNRYAVEIEYTVDDITLTGDSIWNVNTLQYEGTITVETEFDTKTTDATGNGEVEVCVGEFTVTNFSDLAVTVAIGAEDLLDAVAPIDSRIDFDTDNDGNVDGVYKNNAVENKTTDTTSFSAFVKSADWAHVVAQLMANGQAAQAQAANTFTAARFTITVAPATGYSAD